MGRKLLFSLRLQTCVISHWEVSGSCYVHCAIITSFHLYTVSQKTSHFWLAIMLTCTIRVL